MLEWICFGGMGELPLSRCRDQQCIRPRCWQHSVLTRDISVWRSIARKKAEKSATRLSRSFPRGTQKASCYPASSLRAWRIVLQFGHQRAGSGPAWLLVCTQFRRPMMRYRDPRPDDESVNGVGELRSVRPGAGLQQVERKQTFGSVRLRDEQVDLREC